MTSRSDRAMTDLGHITEWARAASNRILVTQAALMLVAEGRSRVTVSEVCERISEEYESFVMPSVAGQVLSSIKVRRVTSHGKSKVILDREHLELAQKELALEVERLEAQAEEIVPIFGDLAERVQELESRMQAILGLSKRRKEIDDYLQSNRPKLFEARATEQRYQKLVAEVKRANQLIQACEDLEEKLRVLPSLTARHRKLQQKMEKHEAKEADIERRERELDLSEQDLDRREEALFGRERRLDLHAMAVDLLEVEKALSERKKELDQVLKQLGEKKGLLSRLLSRDEDGNAR